MNRRAQEHQITDEQVNIRCEHQSIIQDLFVHEIFRPLSPINLRLAQPSPNIAMKSVVSNARQICPLGALYKYPC